MDLYNRRFAIGDFIGSNGNVTNETKFNVFSFVLNISKTALILTWILLLILYYIFYFKSDVPDLIHILDSNENSFYNCFNVSIIKNNINDIFMAIKEFIDGVQRF